MTDVFLNEHLTKSCLLPQLSLYPLLFTTITTGKMKPLTPWGSVRIT